MVDRGDVLSESLSVYYVITQNIPADDVDD